MNGTRFHPVLAAILAAWWLMAGVAQAAPSLRWAQTFDGSVVGDQHDRGFAVAIAPDGATAFVTGQLEVYAPPVTATDVVTLAYDVGTGALLWSATYNGSAGGGDRGNDIVVAPDGKTVYVTGESVETATRSNFLTLAYDASSGAQRWAAHYGYPGLDYDEATAIDVDPSGSAVYVTGPSRGVTGKEDYATVAYSASTGALLWASRYDPPEHLWDLPTDVVADRSGTRVYVTGESFRNATGNDFATVAYRASDGAQLWQKRYTTSGTGSDQAVAAGVSPDGSCVFVTGSSYQAGTTIPRYATLAYDPATGVRQWVARYKGPSTLLGDRPKDLAVAPDGSAVVVTGWSYGAGYSDAADVATVWWDALTGARMVVRRYDGPAHGSDGGQAVVFSPDGAMTYVAAIAPALGEDQDAIIAYGSTTGHLSWVVRGGLAGEDALTVADDGSTLMTTGGGSDIVTAAFSP